MFFKKIHGAWSFFVPITRPGTCIQQTELLWIRFQNKITSQKIKPGGYREKYDF